MTLHLGDHYKCTTTVGSIEAGDCIELLWVDGDDVQVRLSSKAVFDIPIRTFRQCFALCQMCKEV